MCAREYGPETWIRDNNNTLELAERQRSWDTPGDKVFEVVPLTGQGGGEGEGGDG